MNATDIESVEVARLEAQAKCDLGRPKAERNRLGQFATPPALADQVVEASLRLMPRNRRLSFLDPGFGTGAFYSAILQRKESSRLNRAGGFEIDSTYYAEAHRLWASSGLELRHSDFLRADPGPTGAVSLLVSNPPYVRHHHIGADQKAALQARVRRELGLSPSGLSGLYVYFMLLSHGWLESGGVGAWLVPGEFMDVNYGSVLRQYLTTAVQLERIHRFRPEDVQFADALVSSVVVWLRNSRPKPNHLVELTCGGSLTNPAETRRASIPALVASERWSGLFSAPYKALKSAVELRELFAIKRGIATGANKFFVLSESQVRELQLPHEVLRLVLPPPRLLTVDEIPASPEALNGVGYLIDVSLSIEELTRRYPSLARYLRGGEAELSKRYLCHSRTPWYAQEQRAPAPLLCTYMGRTTASGRAPFRFILNKSQATATNVYLMLYPHPFLQKALLAEKTLLRRLWTRLQETTASAFFAESRVYGGGLHKLEPRELSRVQVSLDGLGMEVPSRARQEEMFATAAS